MVSSAVFFTRVPPVSNACSRSAQPRNHRHLIVMVCSDATAVVVATAPEIRCAATCTACMARRRIGAPPPPRNSASWEDQPAKRPTRRVRCARDAPAATAPNWAVTVAARSDAPVPEAGKRRAGMRSSDNE